MTPKFYSQEQWKKKMVWLAHTFIISDIVNICLSDTYCVCMYMYTSFYDHLFLSFAPFPNQLLVFLLMRKHCHICLKIFFGSGSGSLDFIMVFFGQFLKKNYVNLVFFFYGFGWDVPLIKIMKIFPYFKFHFKFKILLT